MKNQLQLKALQAQSEAFKNQTDKIASVTLQVDNLAAGVKSMVEIANGALESQKAYAAGAKQLAGQVADLNKVYGNMLNALV